MANPQIEVEFQSRYTGDLEKQLRNDQRRMAAMQRWLDNHPLEFRYKVDINGIKAQVSQARDAAFGELKKAAPATILGADGKAASIKGTAKELAQVQGLLAEISRTSFNKDGQETGRFLSQIEQIGNGLQRISNFKWDKDKQQFITKSITDKDVTTVKAMDDALRGVNRQLGQEFAAAKGRGDKDGQLAALRKQKAEVDRIVTEASKGGLVGSSAYARAEAQQDRLASKISGMEGVMYSDAEKKSRASRKQEIDRAIKAEEARATAALKANKIEADQAERLLPDRVAYEKEINRIYEARRRIFQESKDFFQQMDKSLLLENRPDLANKAFNRGLNANSQVNQADLDFNRTMTDSARRGEREAEARQKAAESEQKKYDQWNERESAKQLKDDVDRAQQRIRERAAAEKAERDSAFRREMQDIKAEGDKRIAEINKQEKRAKAAAKNNEDRKLAAARTGHSLRQDTYGEMAGRYFALEQKVRSTGNAGLADQVRGKALGAGVAMERDMERFATSTARSARNLDFHSSSLLRNAASFVRWQIPMMAVMSIQRAFNAGIESAIRVDRQFATLQTVFHGTAEEAQQLKKDTLDLAVAQGRSADEAMDSSIRWARLGLTRLQILEATKVSLMAANVAEIDAANAAEKLSAIYATYKLNVGDLGGVLNRLNSISNNYNVTVKDLFEGIARVSGVARQAGLELRDLEGIIGAVTGATGRPGQEIGNALKTIITRLGDPKLGDKLKKAFDIDLTNSNGDLKDMSTIMRELADLYPTLNRAEQQRFLMITAGTRQASRMAQVMTEYRQSQVLAAKAGFDHTASVRENEKILQSLQSRIDGVKATWTELATALGDAGWMERAGQTMRYFQQILQGVSGRMDEITEKSRTFVVQNAMYAEAVEQLGGGENKMFATRSKFNRSEVEETLRLMKEAQAAEIEMQKVRAREGRQSGNSKVVVGSGLNTMNLTFDELSKAITHYQKLLEEGGDTGFEDELKSITKDVINLRDELTALEKSSWTFESLAKAVESGSIDRNGLIRDFQTMANLMLSLPDGQREYSAAVKEFNSLLNAGDNGNMAAFLQRVASMFDATSENLGSGLEQKVTSTTAILDRWINDLEARKMKLMEQPPSQENDDELAKTTSRLKEVRGYIEQVNRQIEKSTESSFGAGARFITQYIENVKAAAQAIGDAFKDFAPDAEGDPVERIMDRQMRTLQLGKEMMERIQQETSRNSQANRISAAEEKDPAIRQRMLEQQDEADSIMRTAIADEEERIEQLRRELEVQQSILQVKRQQTDAQKEAIRSAAAFRFGETDSDKDANQARLVIERARRGISSAEAAWLFNRGTPATRASNAGQVLQDEATARAALESMSRRNYEIDAARAQLAFDTARAMKEQTEEASKRYQLATREDQLRASVLARGIRDRGDVKENEFSMLSQNLRQALVNYLPDKAPGMLNEARANESRTRRELDEEQARLKENITGVGDSLLSLSERINQIVRRGGALDVMEGIIPPRSVQDVANTRDNAPVVNLSVSDVYVQIRLAEEMKPIMEGIVRPLLDAGLKNLENRLRQQTIPNSQGFVE
jgi:TP901 family phage tail tape measure protein